MTTQSLPTFTDHNSTQKFLDEHAAALLSIYSDAPGTTFRPVRESAIAISALSLAQTCLIHEDLAADSDAAPQSLNANDHSSRLVVDLVDLPGLRFLGRAVADVLPLGLLVNSYPVAQIEADFDIYSAERAQVFRAVRETSCLAGLLQRAEEQRGEFAVRHIHSVTISNEQQYQQHAPMLIDSLLYYNPEDYDCALLIAGDRSEQSLVRNLNLKPVGRGSQCWFMKSPDMASYDEEQWV